MISKYKPLLKLFVALALFGLVFYSYDIKGQYLLGLATSPQFWLVCLLGNFLVSLLTTLRWRVLLARFANAPVRFWPLFLYGWYGQFAGLAFFGTFGADFARGYLLKVRENVSLADGAKTILLDRVAGTISLALLCLAALPFYYGFSFPISIGIAVVVVLPNCLRAELFLSFSAHLVKLGMVVAILYLGDPSTMSDGGLVARLTLGLGIENLPFSWQGFGLGHLGFAAFLKDRGVDLYNGYFLGKIAFKLLGGVGLVGAGARQAWAQARAASR